MLRVQAAPLQALTYSVWLTHGDTATPASAASLPTAASLPFAYGSTSTS
jgi:hypothetical protein